MYNFFQSKKVSNFKRRILPVQKEHLDCSNWASEIETVGALENANPFFGVTQKLPKTTDTYKQTHTLAFRNTQGTGLYGLPGLTCGKTRREPLTAVFDSEITSEKRQG